MRNSRLPGRIVQWLIANEPTVVWCVLIASVLVVWYD